LNRGLALAPGPDPETASSSCEELRLDGLVILSRPAEVCGEELVVAPSTTPRLTEIERLAGPSAP
jgi:hypothetical protein